MRTHTNLVAFFLALFVLGGCADNGSTSDAYGNFEAIEILVSAEVGGRLDAFTAREGDRLNAGREVGLVDTLRLALQRQQVDARRKAVRSRFPGIAAQVEVLETQRSVAHREKARVEGLLADGAATAKQLDDVSGQLDVLQRQIASIRAQNAPVFAELDVLTAERAMIDDQIRRSRIVNPVDGTVLVTFVEQSELVAPGRMLYRIARLDTLNLRAYLSGAQLADVRLGEQVTVLIDDQEGYRSHAGVVSWISDESEFTPKLIQTKEERVSLVYAFKVRVPNPEGVLKIGMPGEVVFASKDTTNE